MGKLLPAFLRPVSGLAAAGTLLLAACGGGGGGGGLPPATPTPSPTLAPSVACPSTGSAPSAVASQSGTESARRSVTRPAGATRYVPGQLAITYDGANDAQIDDTAAGFHGSRVAQLPYGSGGLRTRIVSVDPASADAAIARLRALSGVRDVAKVTYRHRMAITANDPYYVGFTGTAAPYFETASIPGQWDMHVMSLDGAWSQFSAAPIVAAPIAVIDTGVDVTHPELVTPSGVTAPKITRTQCFVTYPASGSQTTGSFVTDTDGHGTNVAGIADGDTSNSFAFASVAFDAPLLAYRIFPSDPPGGCEGSSNTQCDTTSADEASAIYDAVAHGAKVINLSLGADPPCATNDPEYTAVEYAISHGVVVVAAAGNGNAQGVGQPDLVCPAADPGVIAVGATSLNDTNPTSVFEYVASYSNYLTTDGTSNGGAYVVAPGGDPSGASDSDNLHWIEHIYSSTAVQSGGCTTDFAQETGNCRVLIAGTSMAVPHVAGVVSLMLAKNPALTPASIATGLCASVDNIGDSKAGCGRVNASKAVTWAATH